MPDIELPPIVQERSAHVLLHNVGELLAVGMVATLHEQVVQLFERVDDMDAIATIAVLSWLDDPNI